MTQAKKGCLVAITAFMQLAAQAMGLDQSLPLEWFEEQSVVGRPISILSSCSVSCC